MMRRELVKNISKKIGVSRNICDLVLDGFIEEIEEQLSKGNEVRIQGFVRFYVGIRKACRHRNPKTGLMEDSPETPFVKCKTCAAFRNAVNGRNDIDEDEELYNEEADSEEFG